MYLRIYKRANKNGTIAEYYQLAHNERDPETKQPVAQIAHNFGRADGHVRDELFRLCRSIARVCQFELTDFMRKSEGKLKNTPLPGKEKDRTMRQITEDLKASEENVLANVNEFILPNLEKLKTMKMQDHEREVLEIMEKDLRDIISSFGKKLSSKYYNLTSMELHIANLIKYGRTTKGISELLNLSPRTVEFHRNNIRKKFGINKKGVNLKSFLLSPS